MELVIDAREGGDWSLDLCFAGLVYNLGPENVVDYPAKKKHREWNHDIADWGMERRTLGWTPRNHEIPMRSRVDVLELIRSRKITRVWLDESYAAFDLYCGLGLKAHDIPVVVVAGHDRFWNFSPEYVYENYYGRKLWAMLLDNWQPAHEHLPFPSRWMSWSTNFDHYWDGSRNRPKEWDICFFGYNSHPDRARFIDHIERKWPDLKTNFVFERRPDITDVYLRKYQYFSMMDRSRICLNLRGAAEGGKTMRFYEIPYVGSFMLSQVMPDHNLQREFRQHPWGADLSKDHCRYFLDENELDDAITWALDDPLHRELVASQGAIHARDTHTVQARYRDVLGWLDGLEP